MVEGIIPAETEGIILAEIESEPDAIAASLNLREAARETVARVRARGLRRLYVIGNGTSYHTGLAAATLYRRMAQPHEPLVVPMTAGEFYHYPPALGPDDALLGISASGEFREVVAAVRAVHGRVPTIGVVHATGSTLAGIADHVLLAPGGPTAVPVMTKTFASTFAVTCVLMGELLGGDRANQVADSLQLAANAASKAIADATARVASIAGTMDKAQSIFVVGGGCAFPAALEAALKLKEMALVHAEGVETWEMETGAATLIGPRTTVIALEPAGPALEAVRRLVRHCADWGAPIIEVAVEPTVEGSQVLPLPDGAAEDYAALVAVPPVALLAFALARLRGLDPDRPAWASRYRSQGLTHVIGA